MTPKQAGTRVQGWIERHTRAVLHTLACAGVPAADRPDLAQEVFLTAYGILLRSLFTVDHPRAWLCAIATRHASDYRRAAGRRLCLTPVDEAPSDLASPEQSAGERELVRLALEQLDEETRGVVLDVRAEGLSWDEIARERGLTVRRAKYLYVRALQRMEVALSKAAQESRRSFVVVIALNHTFESLRGEADVAPALRGRIWAAVEEAMDGGPLMPANGLEPDRGPASVSIQIYAPAPAMPAGSGLGLLGGGVALGALVVCLLRPPAAAEPPGTPADDMPPTSSHTVADSELRRATRATHAAVLTTAGTAGDEDRHPRVESPRRVAAGHPRARPSVAPPRRLPGPFDLLDQARAAVAVDDVPAAFAALTPHQLRFAHGPGAAERQHLLRVACARPAAREEPACAGEPPGFEFE